MDKRGNPIRVGDYVGVIIGGPGMDTSYCLVTAIDGDSVSGYDPSFNLAFTIRADWVWLASDAALETRLTNIDGVSGSWRELLEAVRTRLLPKSER